MAYRRDDEPEYIEDDDFFDSESVGGRSRVLGGSGSRQPQEFDQPPEDYAAARQPNAKRRSKKAAKKASNPAPSLASDQERRARLAGKHDTSKKRRSHEEPAAPTHPQSETRRFGKLRARFSRGQEKTERSKKPAQPKRTRPLAAVGRGLGNLRSRFSRGAGSETEPQRPPRQQPQSKRPSRAPKIGSSGWLDLDRKLDLVGVALVFGAILFTISALSAEQAAIGALHQLIGQLLGWGAVALPLAMFAIGMWLIVRHFGDEPPIIDPLRMAGAALAFLGALALLQYFDSLGYTAVMPTIPACANATSPVCMEALVQESYQQARGGGVIGGWLYGALVKALTELGGLVAVGMLLTVGTMLITRSSTTELALAGISLWRGARTRLGQYAAAQRAARMQAQQAMPQAHDQPPLHLRKPDAPRLDSTARAAPALPEPRSDWMPIPARLRAFFSRRQTAVPQADMLSSEIPEAPVQYRSPIESPYAAPPAPRQTRPAARPAPRSDALERFLNPGDDLPAPPARTVPISRPQPAPPLSNPAPPTMPPKPTPAPVEPPPPQPSSAPAAATQARHKWELPAYQDLLDSASASDLEQEPLMQQAQIIEDTLAAFGAPGNVIEINSGPVITQYGVEPLQQTASTGKRSRVKVGDIAKLDKDLQLALGAKSIRMEAPVPGKGYVGIEVPNPLSARVSLRDVLESESYRKLESPLAIALGMTVDGTPVAADLAQMPHLLIAGATGAGKSVCVNAIINSILLRNSPETVKFIMIDPKRVELTSYNGLPHLVAPVVVELERAIGVLRWVTAEMEKRYQTLYQAGMLNIIDYNKTLDPDLPPMSYIVVIIDELADLMMLAPKEIELIVRRIVAVARATGIHMILATQRPSVDVVTGVIKANCPARIAFSVASGVDSRVILGTPGAERLLGKGDMLYLSGDAPAPRRMQGVFVSEDEKERIGKFWRMRGAGIEPVDPIPPAQRSLESASALPPAASSQGEQAAFWEMPKPDAKRQASSAEDDLYQTAVEMVRRLDRASISLLQRKMRIGYGRAARLMDMMEERGVVGPAKEGSSKPRDVLPLA